MITVSLCMIVKNEQHTLTQCLRSVCNVVDEIIIVDTGSTDLTKEIAGLFEAKIYDFIWRDDFAAARNYSFSKATKEYILWLDADDIMLAEDVKKFAKLKETLDTQIDCVRFIYRCGVDDQGNASLLFYRDRLVKRSCNYRFIGFLHEYLPIEGRIKEADISVIHTRVVSHRRRNLAIYERKLMEGTVLTARDQYHYGKELYYHEQYDKAMELLERSITSLERMDDQIDALYKLADCYIIKKDYNKARDILAECFMKTIPRADGYYRMGKSYQKEGNYAEAIRWYEAILRMKQPVMLSGFYFPEYWTWRPLVELTVCYFIIGDLKRSYEYNERCYEYLPDDPAIISNRAYFQQILHKGE